MLWGLGGIWLIASSFIVYACLVKGKKTERMFWKSLIYSFGISHLISPSLIGFTVISIPVPATYSIYGFLLSIACGDLWIFNHSDAKFYLMLSTVSFFSFFLIVWMIIGILLKTITFFRKRPV
jgi:hypothetical protein